MERRRIRRKKQLRKYVCGIGTGGILLMATVLLLGGDTVKSEDTRQESRMHTVTTVSDKVIEKDLRKERIQQILAEDVYGPQLAELYKKNPKTEQIILNRAQYSDEIIGYLVTHPEAMDWVAEYPEKMAQGAEVIDQIALETVNLSDHQVRNAIPVYYQWSSTWGYASYGNGCIAMDGCGPTCLSMVATGLTGDASLTPKKIADLAVQSGFYTDGSGTSWDLMTEGAQRLGLTVREVGWSRSALEAELVAGRPVICSMGPGNFTAQGHFIVLTGLSEDGKVLVNDPNSRVNTRKKWDLQVLLDQAKNMWVYG